MISTRSSKNPIITPAMVKPSRPDFQVVGTFNGAVCEHEGGFIMLVRVAERFREDSEGYVRLPQMEKNGHGWEIGVKTIARDDADYDFSDPRGISSKSDPSSAYLTTLSHIRLARSVDGETFDVADDAFIAPSTSYELFGCEDPRVIKIENRYYINYSAVSPKGITTMLAVTDDFTSVEKLGLIFAPDNRDVCLFPEKINGKYWALHRPAPKYLGRPEIWLSASPDLIHWGEHRHLLGCSARGWDSLKIGGGAPMLKTKKGWLQIYHGVNERQNYALGAFLLDLEDPTVLLAKSPGALLLAQAEYELNGFFPDVLFSCAALIRGDRLDIYYGASDETMALASLSLADLWKFLDV